MKILITENKRYQLAYKVLDNILDGLTREDKDMNVNSVFSNHRVLFKDGNGNIVLELRGGACLKLGIKPGDTINYLF